MSELDYKKAFALSLLARPGKQFDVAFDLFRSNDDTAKALWAATNWPNDPEVIAFQRAVVAEPEATGALPTKYQAAFEVLDRARKCKDDDSYCKLMTLYGTLMGQIEKPGQPASQQANVIINKVIMMPATVSKEDWSRQATTQQRSLILEGEVISAAK